MNLREQAAWGLFLMAAGFWLLTDKANIRLNEKVERCERECICEENIRRSHPRYEEGPTTEVSARSGLVIE